MEGVESLVEVGLGAEVEDGLDEARKGGGFVGFRWRRKRGGGGGGGWHCRLKEVRSVSVTICFEMFYFCQFVLSDGKWSKRAIYIVWSIFVVGGNPLDYGFLGQRILSPWVNFIIHLLTKNFIMLRLVKREKNFEGIHHFMFD